MAPFLVTLAVLARGGDAAPSPKLLLTIAPAIAGVYTVLGESNTAFEWLEKGFEEHSPYMASIGHDFIFEPLRSDPRWTDLMRRIGLGSPQARGDS